MAITKTIRFISALFILSCAGYAYPCTCADPPLEQKFKESSAVFAGEIIGMERSTLTHYEYSVRFKVDRVWKGAAGSEIEMLAGHDVPGMCNDLYLATGERYLVYADTDKDGCLYIARECGPSGNMRYAGAEVEQLELKYTLRRPTALSADGIGAEFLYVLSFLAGCAWLAKRRYEGR